jgi:hypothetical protein
MFEAAERLLKRRIEQILGISVIIGLPDPDWIKKNNYPCGAVMLSSVKIADCIEDGSPDSSQDHGDHVIENYCLSEAEMIFAFHLLEKSKVKLDQLTLKLIYELSKSSVINSDLLGQTQPDEDTAPQTTTPNSQYALGPLQFRDEQPDPESERVFERIFAIPLTGNIYETIKAPKGTIQYIPAVSTSEDVLKQINQEET